MHQTSPIIDAKNLYKIDKRKQNDMKSHTEGLHHFHTRKRIHQKHEQYPHPNKWKRLMDRLIYLIGIVGPIMTIPQVAEVWLNKNASGISVITWASYVVINVFWIIYGTMHKEKPIIVTSIAWLIMNSLVAIGAILYG